MLTTSQLCVWLVQADTERGMLQLTNNDLADDVSDFHGFFPTPTINPLTSASAML